MDVEETEKQHVLYIWLISQDENTGHDTYDAAVVCAVSEEKARLIHPCTYLNRDPWIQEYIGDDHGWCRYPSAVTVRLLGIAEDDAETGVVLASFNAG